MSTEKYIDELKEGCHATNRQTNEIVDLIGTLTLDNGLELWVVENDTKGLHLINPYCLVDPFYWD